MQLSFRSRVYHMLFEFFLIAMALLFFVPILIVIFNSLKTAPEAAPFNLSLPLGFHFENFIRLFSEIDVAGSMFNGFIYCLFTGAGVIFMCSMSSFVLARSRKNIYSIIYYLFIAGLFIPFSIIPTIRMMQMLFLYGNRFGLIMMYIVLNLSFIVFLYTGFVKSISRELDEAAVIDGCGPYNLFFRVIFPLLKPVTITAFLLVAIGVWNEFYLQLFLLPDSDMWGMPISIYYFFGLYDREWNMVSADIVIASIPVTILFLISQKYIAGGTAGAIKG